jgi:hypothetical protein
VWWLREDKKIAGGEDCKPKKKTIGERGRWLGFGREKKLDLGFFFVVALNFSL